MPDKKKLFQYAVLLHKYETKDGKKEYVDTEVVIQPKVEMATSEKQLVFKITREIPEDKATDPDNVEILIRPF